MDALDRDILLFYVLFAILLGILFVVPLLYIYVRRTTAKPRIKTAPAVPLTPTLPAPNPPPTELSPAKPTRPNLPQPKPVPPEKRLRAAYQITFIVGFFALANSILPIYRSIRPEAFPAYTDVASYYLKSGIVGTLLLILGFLIRRRSLPALMAAMAIFVLNGLADFIVSVSNSVTTSILVCSGLYILFILSIMYGGIRAIHELERAALAPPEQL